MTPMARVLWQGKSLRASANESTNDVNEAYLVVHQVMTHAIRRIGDEEADLHPALMSALRQTLAAIGGSDMTQTVSTFQISERHSIWRVTLDGEFYSDYRSLSLATEGADAGAESLRAKGNKATVVAPTRS